MKTSEFLALFFGFALIALSGLTITQGVVDYHLDLTAALTGTGAGSLYGLYRTVLKYKATPTSEPVPPPSAEDVAKQVLSQLKG